MAIFDQDINIDHLPNDFKEIYDILLEVDMALHKEDRLIREEKTILEGHKDLLDDIEKRAEGQHTRVLISALKDLAGQLWKLHQKISWTESELHGLEKQLKETTVSDWKSDPLIKFLNKLEEQMQLEEFELFDEKQLIEQFEKCAEQEAGHLPEAERQELKEVLNFLLDHSTRLFRLQKLILDTISLLGTTE